MFREVRAFSIDKSFSGLILRQLFYAMFYNLYQELKYIFYQ